MVIIIELLQKIIHFSNGPFVMFIQQLFLNIPFLPRFFTIKTFCIKQFK